MNSKSERFCPIMWSFWQKFRVHVQQCELLRCWVRCSMCYLVKRADYVVVHPLKSSLFFCMFGLHAIEKDLLIIPHFDCDFVYFFFSNCQVYFKAMFCYLSWILLSIIYFLRVHLIIIMKIPSLIQLVYLGLSLLSGTLI